jgi:hypothetical protein
MEKQSFYSALIAFIFFTEYGLTQNTEPRPAHDKVFERIEIVNERYLKNVKPIFVKSCFDCHSNQTRYPWYHSLPLIKQLLDEDTATGKKHLEMSDDFPFEGHGSTEEDLKAIDGSIVKGSMPPFKYLIMHPSSRLTIEEEKTIREWVRESLKTLKEQ